MNKKIINRNLDRMRFVYGVFYIIIVLKYLHNAICKYGKLKKYFFKI